MTASDLEHTAAVIDALESDGVTTGNHKAPAEQPPHTTVYLIPGGQIDGTAGDPDGDVQYVYQLTSTGTGIEQALWEADRAAAALLGKRLEVEGRSLQPVRLLMTSSGQRDDDVQPPVFYVVRRIGFWSFPAT